MKRAILPAVLTLAIGVPAAMALPANLEEAIEQGYEIFSDAPASDGGGSEVFYLRKRADVIVCGITLNYAAGDFVTRAEVLKSSCKDVK